MTTMSDRRWHRPGMVGPILLIAIGLLLLLSNLGRLQFNWWDLWRLWPLILVLIGLDILSRHSRLASALVAVVTLALIGGGVYYLLTRPEPLRPLADVGSGPHATRTVTEDLGGAKEVTVNLHMGVGQLRLTDLSDSSHLFEGSLNYPTGWSAPEVRYDVQGERGQLTIEGRNRTAWGFYFPGSPNGDDWQVRLSREVPLILDVDGGASSSSLDLRHLTVRELRIGSGVGRMEITFPAEGQNVVARVDGGVGELVLHIPETMPARIRIDGGLGGQQLASRFTRVGEHTYESASYAGAANRLDISIHGGVGSVRVD